MVFQALAEAAKAEERRRRETCIFDGSLLQLAADESKMVRIKGNQNVDMRDT